MKQRLQNGSPIELFEVMYTDFTTIEYDSGSRSLKLMPIIGHSSKLIAGWALGSRRCQELACQAWEHTRQKLEKMDVNWNGMIIHQDQDSVYKSDLWVDQLLLEDGVRLSYSTNGARGNTYMESFNGHFKRPIQSLLNEAVTTSEVKEVIAKRVEKWNQERRHSSIGQIAPVRYIEEQREEKGPIDRNKKTCKKDG